MKRKYQLILLFFLFIILASLSFILSPFFHIREFAIHSRNQIDKASLRAYLNEFYGENILFVKENDLENKLLEHRLVSSISIEKSYPSKIHIIIEERKAAAWINNNNKKLLFSADGIILEQIDLEKEIDFPEIEGFEYLFSKNKLVLPDEANKLLTNLNKFELDFIKKIKKISFSNNVLKLYLKNNSQVNLGEANDLEDKFTLLNSIIIKLEKEKQEYEYVNLKVPKHPVIKLKDN
jgi:cell division protein FtsQ